MPAVLIKGVGWLLAHPDNARKNRNRVTLRTGRGVRLTLNARNVTLPSEEFKMVETKRMRTEHLNDQGAATDDNPRLYRTEDMPPDVNARYRAAQDAATRGDDTLMNAWVKQYGQEYSNEENTQPFGATTTKPSSSTQPPKVVGGTVNDANSGQTPDDTGH